VDLIAIPCLVLPELGWYIYGNTLVWDASIMGDCKQNEKLVYWTVGALVIYGYIFMLMFLIVALAAIAVYCYFRIYGTKTEEQGLPQRSTASTKLEAEAHHITDIGFLSEITKFQARKNRGYSIYQEEISAKSSLKSVG